MNHSDYKYKTSIQIRFSDMDRLNHVNNACYHSYIELARVHYLNEVLARSVNWNEQGFVLARTVIDHLSLLFLGDDAFCYTKVIRLGTKSITVKNTVAKINQGNLLICAEAESVLVAMDYKKGNSIMVPSEWRKLISDFENL